MRGAGLGVLRGSGGSSALTARTSIRPMLTRTVGPGVSRSTRAGNDGLTGRLGRGAARVGCGEGAVAIVVSAGISTGPGDRAAPGAATVFSAPDSACVGLSRGGGAALARVRATGTSAVNARTG